MKRAAELLGTNPTTVSRHLSRLSDDIGQSLYARAKDGSCSLTVEGEKLKTLAAGFKDEIANLDFSEMEGEAPAQITITSLEFLLTHYLAPELKNAPEVVKECEIQLVGTDKRLSLAYGEADLALRFGRPVDGQLIASKIAEIEFDIWVPEGRTPTDWVGFQEDLEWTPEMQFALKYFGRPPAIRVSSFAAARNAAVSLGMGAIGPSAVMMSSPELSKLPTATPIRREVWSIIHESQRRNQRLGEVRKWVREAVQAVQVASGEVTSGTRPEVDRSLKLIGKP